MSELAILVPVLGRPHRVAPLLASIFRATPDAHVLFIVSPGDRAVRAAIDTEQLRDPSIDALEHDGNYAAKINRGVRETDEPLLFFGADDLDFHPGWFEAAKVQLSESVGLVGTQDLCNRRVLAGEHATHFLVARWYAELGTIDGQEGPCFEGYPHEYYDDELVQTAKARDAWAFAHDSVVEHLHPDAGKAPTDELYDARPARMRQGRRVYRRRSHLWT